MGHACPEIDLVWMLQAESQDRMTTLDIQRPTPHVARVWLNRPDVRNAFNDSVIAELTAGLRRAGRRTPNCARSCSAATARPSAPAPTCRG